jgi:hypothetical protein
MKLLAYLPFCFAIVVLLTLAKFVNNFPVSGEYSSYDFYSNEDPGQTDFTKKKDCLKRYKDEEDIVDGINSDFGSKINCKPEIGSDYNGISNDVLLVNESTDKNITHDNSYNKTCTKNKSLEHDKISESEIRVHEHSDNFSDGTSGLIFEQSDDKGGDTVPDDILYEDMPGILIFYVVNDDGETHNIEVENAVKISGDEITVNYNRALQALAVFIDDFEMSSEEEMEGTEDIELEEPQRIVENGYILYDMGE